MSATRTSETTPATREAVMQKLLDEMQRIVGPLCNPPQLDSFVRTYEILHSIGQRESFGRDYRKPAGLDSGLALTESKLTAPRVKYLAHARRKSKAKP